MVFTDLIMFKKKIINFVIYQRIKCLLIFFSYLKDINYLKKIVLESL